MAAATPAKRGEEKEELKEELRTPRPGGGARSPRSGGSSPRTPASTSPKERRRSYEVSFFKAKGASKADIKRRHEMFGYDPLDKAIYEEREHLARSLGLLNGPSSPGAPSPPRGSAAHEERQTRLLREYDANVRELLRDHLMTMAASGIVFNHVFTTPKLGFSILIARYGAMGRMFVEVEETYGSCQEKRLKPTDELIAIDGEVIDAPAADKPLRALALIKKKIAKAGRPVRRRRPRRSRPRRSPRSPRRPRRSPRRRSRPRPPRRPRRRSRPRPRRPRATAPGRASSRPRSSRRRRRRPGCRPSRARASATRASRRPSAA